MATSSLFNLNMNEIVTSMEIDDIQIGNNHPLLIVAGPCVTYAISALSTAQGPIAACESDRLI